MSDAHGPTDPPVGGPSWMRNRRPVDQPTVAVPAAPSGVAPTPAPAPTPPGAGWATSSPGPAVLDGEVSLGAISTDPERVRPPALRYSRHAITPVPFAAVSLVSIAALLLAVRWARSGSASGDLDALRTLNEAWFTVRNLLIAQLDATILRSPAKASVVLVMSGIAAATVVVWVARLGRNLPLSELTFGAGLAVLGLPAWWTLSLTIGTFDDPATTRIDLLVRLAFAAALLTLQFVLVRWGLLNKIWRAGRLPFDQAAILLWLPEFIPWMMFLGSSVYTLGITEEGEAASDTWRPTQTMIDWGQAMSIATAVGILVLLVVVTVRQHVGMAEDRRVDQEARDADRRNREAHEVTPS